MVRLAQNATLSAQQKQPLVNVETDFGRSLEHASKSADLFKKKTSLSIDSFS